MKHNDTIRAIAFDAYGTLFDVYSVGALAEQLFPGKGEALTALWRLKQIEYSFLRTLSNRYRCARGGRRHAGAFGVAGGGVGNPGRQQQGSAGRAGTHPSEEHCRQAAPCC